MRFWRYGVGLGLCDRSPRIANSPRKNIGKPIVCKFGCDGRPCKLVHALTEALDKIENLKNASSFAGTHWCNLINIVGYK